MMDDPDDRDALRARLDLLERRVRLLEEERASGAPALPRAEPVSAERSQVPPPQAAQVIVGLVVIAIIIIAAVLSR